jgi:uncharacterized protein (DUF1015 family)
MMTLVAFDDPGLVILPTHRVVRRLVSDFATRFATRVSESFAVDEIGEPEQFLGALPAHGRGAIGVRLKGDDRYRILTIRDPRSLTVAMPDAPPAVRALEVSILHTLIFERIFGISSEEVKAGGNLEYTIDAWAALAEVTSGRADGAFLMNPPTVRDVAQVSAAGVTMPEKSTYFFPKLLTGLLLNPLDE